MSPQRAYRAKAEGASPRTWTDGRETRVNRSRNLLATLSASAVGALVAGLASFAGCDVSCQGPIAEQDGGTRARPVALVCDGSPCTLAIGHDAPNVIASDGTRVYWGSLSARIWSIPVGAGTPPTLLADLFDKHSDPRIEAIAVDSSNVYWTLENKGSGAVFMMPKDGGMVTQLATALGAPGAIAVDATHVYWVDDGIERVPISGGPVTTLVPLGGGDFSWRSTLAVDDKNIYWTTHGGGELLAASLDGGPRRALASPAWSVAVSDGGVYFATNDSVFHAAEDGGAPTMLATIGVDAGFMAPWASQLMVDGTNLYWLDELPTGTINRVPIVGGELLPLNRDLLFGSSNQQFTVDSTSLYWLENISGDDVAIMKSTPK